MMSVEQCSRRFDFVRLHKVAWERRLIRKPRSMAQDKVDGQLAELLVTVASGLLKEYGIPFKIHRDYEQVRLEMTELAEWLDEVKATRNEVIASQLTLPTKEYPNTALPCKELQISCATESLTKLDHDLALLAALDQTCKDETDPEKQIKAPSPFGMVMPKRRRRRAS